jgi:hypothetical protein
VRADGFRHLPPAVDQVHDSVRKAALLQQLEDALLRQRNLLRWLQNEGVTADHREGQEPQRDHRGKVERRDHRAHADRLPHDLAIETRRDVLESVAHEHGRCTARHFHTLDAAAHAAPCFVKRLAVFGRDDARDFFEMVVEELAEREHRARADHRRRLAPVMERTGRGGHSSVELVRGGQRCARDGHTACRVMDVDVRVPARRHPLPVDEVVEHLNV